MSAKIILNETLDAYHASDCVSNSKLGVLDDGGPALFHGRFISKNIPKPEPTEALILGCAFDTLVTEAPGKFSETYVVKPEGMNFATKEGKAWRDAHCPDKTKVIAWDDWCMFESMQMAMLENEIFSKFIHKNIISQATVRMESTKYGVGVQSKPDWLSLVPCEFSDGKPYSANLKTTKCWSDWFDESSSENQKNGLPILNYNYHRQAAIDQWCLFNSEIGETAHFLLVVEKCEPYRVAWVQMTDEYLELGWNKADAGLTRIKKCIDENKWPKTSQQIYKIGPPKWLK